MTFDLNVKGMTYKCARCGHIVTGDELELLGEIKCINCGYRVLVKIKPPMAKRLKGV
jgi:DNA-directed RNA polymerase subunit RPC12/RpoP